MHMSFCWFCHVQAHLKMSHITILLYAISEQHTDQPAHQCSLTSTFIVFYIDSITTIVAISKSHRLNLASVAEQASLV